MKKRKKIKNKQTNEQAKTTNADSYISTLYPPPPAEYFLIPNYIYKSLSFESQCNRTDPKQNIE